MIVLNDFTKLIYGNKGLLIELANDCPSLNKKTKQSFAEHLTWLCELKEVAGSSDARAKIHCLINFFDIIDRNQFTCLGRYINEIQEINKTVSTNRGIVGEYPMIDTVKYVKSINSKIETLQNYITKNLEILSNIKLGLSEIYDNV